MHQLKPRHIYLCGGRSTPLTSLQQDKAYRSTSKTLTFESLDELTLWVIELEANVRATALAFDERLDRSPKEKIMLLPESEEHLNECLPILFRLLSVPLNKELGYAPRLG